MECARRSKNTIKHAIKDKAVYEATFRATGEASSSFFTHVGFLENARALVADDDEDLGAVW